MHAKYFLMISEIFDWSKIWIGDFLRMKEWRAGQLNLQVNGNKLYFEIY